MKTADSFNYEPGGTQIPKGQYNLKFLEYRTEKVFGVGKLVLRFSVADGPHRGTELERYYNVTLVGKPGLRGRFKPPRRGDFILEYCRLFPERIPKRRERLPMTPFSHFIIEGEVRTVKSNNRQRALPSPMRYSVVGELLRTKPNLIP